MKTLSTTMLVPDPDNKIRVLLNPKYINSDNEIFDSQIIAFDGKTNEEVLNKVMVVAAALLLASDKLTYTSTDVDNLVLRAAKIK